MAHPCGGCCRPTSVTNKKKKKKIVATKVRKNNFVENVVRKKSLLSKLMKKYVEQKKHQMVTGNIHVHNREGIRQKYIFQFLNTNLKKNCRTFIAKKIVFLQR